MIILNQIAINKIAVTLNELTTLVSPVFYLFEFINDDANDAVYCISLDNSPNPNRYNYYDIELTDGVEDPLNGVITLRPSGSWKYNVYQQDNDTNLDVSLAGDRVETGRVNVIGDIIPSIEAYVSLENENNIVYYNNN